MIVTFTPNPSLDITFTADHAIQRGQVARMATSQTIAGGKGVNVSRVTHAMGHSTLAIVPCDPQDPFVRLLALSETPFEIIPTDVPVRVNTTLSEPGGVTTKLNGPGALLDDSAQRAAASMLLRRLGGADWLVMAGSLPPGAPNDWYAQLAWQAKQRNPQLHVAVDTSGSALSVLLNPTMAAPVDVFCPNTEELIAAIDAPVTAESIEDAALLGDFRPAVQLAQPVIRRLTNAHHRPVMLLTLGAAGALLVSATQIHIATAPSISVVSTVGAGDCALAGYVCAAANHAPAPERLTQAVLWGSAAATLPGTAVPTPAQLTGLHTTTTHFSPTTTKV
ncbi:1-phosphofructokinase family hexose kinase [Corynebacterium choanae]|nr:1-phosphofructokinase family hexose kinase [Corynebacterium choanae]